MMMTIETLMKMGKIKTISDMNGLYVFTRLYEAMACDSANVSS